MPVATDQEHVMKIIVIATKEDFNDWIRAQPPALREYFTHAYQPEHLQFQGQALIIGLHGWGQLRMAVELREIVTRLKSSEQRVAVIMSSKSQTFV